ncbi:hypothetical protein BGX34_007884 [Mortierella sp. NVP85]|nr:hypothetical protein BGX34_007884 [Mortierella sp. NVP85]
MASAMGGPLLSTPSTANPSSSSPAAASSSSAHSKTKKELNSNSGEGTVRLFYSLKDNPNAIISYTDLIRQEQKRQRASHLLSLSSSSKNTGTTAPAPSTASTPTKNQGAKDGSAAQSSSSAAMDVDPPEGEEALGEADSEAEDDEEEEEDEDENEDGTEAEDEDDEDDPDDDEEGEDDPESSRREPKDFLDALTEKYAGLEEGNEGEDEDEDEDDDGKERVLKRPSRWDTEHYDIEDEFIDDSEMMLEAIGMVRPKMDGFFAYRGPVETTNEDPDSSDAGPRTKRSAKKKQAASSPLNTTKGSSKGNKGSSSLAVMENANDSTSELSEMDDKPKAVKASASSGLANSTTPGDNQSAFGSTEAVAGSTTTTPTKKKTAPSKAKAAAKDIAKDGAEANKDSDKDSKSGTTKKAKAKPSKAAAAAAAAAAATSTTPIVRVDSPPPSDAAADQSIPPPVPSRSSSPSRSKSKAKATATIEIDLTGTSSGDVEMSVATTESMSNDANESLRSPTTESASKSSPSGEGSSKAKGTKNLEPLNEEVQTAYNIVAELAKKETWEVRARFPPHIKPHLFECARIALTTRSSGYVLEDNFFFHLQTVLPYNKFTLKKLVYRNVLPKWIADLEAQKARLIDQFTTRANNVWKSSGMADLPDKDGDGDVAMGEEGKPQKKFPWTQDLRLLLWETMEKFMEILAAKQEFRTIDESQPAPFSDSKTRKDAYQTLLQSFPPGCMTSYEISRQYSQLKEKVQKQEKKETESNSTTVPIGKPRPVFSGAGGAKNGTTTAAVRATSAQPSGATAARPQTATSPATATIPVPTSPQTTPATASSTGTHASSGETSRGEASRGETSRDQTLKSPSKSPSIVHRSAALSDIVHSTPSQPRTQHAFASDAIAGNAANRKRRKSEEGKSSKRIGIHNMLLSNSAL